MPDKIKFHFHSGTVPVFFVGILLIVLGLAIIWKGNSPGLFWKAEGTEACIKGACVILLSIFLITRPIYESKDRDWTKPELFAIVIAGLACEILPHFLIQLIRLQN